VAGVERAPRAHLDARRGEGGRGHEAGRVGAAFGAVMPMPL
jgi:hypothetical protein